MKTADEKSEKDGKPGSRVFQTVEPDNEKAGHNAIEQRKSDEHVTEEPNCRPPGWI
jgi:hypothetical protein